MFKKLAPDQQIDAALVFNDPAYLHLVRPLIAAIGGGILRLLLTSFFLLIGHLEIRVVSRSKPVMVRVSLLFFLRRLSHLMG